MLNCSSWSECHGRVRTRQCVRCSEPESSCSPTWEKIICSLEIETLTPDLTVKHLVIAAICIGLVIVSLAVLHFLFRQQKLRCIASCCPQQDQPTDVDCESSVRLHYPNSVRQDDKSECFMQDEFSPQEDFSTTSPPSYASCMLDRTAL